MAWWLRVLHLGDTLTAPKQAPRSKGGQGEQGGHAAMHSTGHTSAGRNRGADAPLGPSKTRSGVRGTTPVHMHSPPADPDIIDNNLFQAMLTQMEGWYKDLFGWVKSLQDPFLINFVIQTITHQSPKAAPNAGEDVRFFQWIVLSEIARASRATALEHRKVFGINVDHLPTFLVAANMQGIKMLYGSENPHILKAFTSNDSASAQRNIDTLVEHARAMSSAIAADDKDTTAYRVLMLYSWPECDGIADVDWTITVYRYSTVHDKMVDGIRTISHRHATLHEGRSIINVHGSEAPAAALQLFRTHFSVRVFDGKALIPNESDDQIVAQLISTVNNPARVYSTRVKLAGRAIMQLAEDVKEHNKVNAELKKTIESKDAELASERAQMKLLGAELDESEKKRRSLASMTKSLESKRHLADERAREADQALKDARALMSAQMEGKRTQLAAAQDKIVAIDNDYAALGVKNLELSSERDRLAKKAEALAAENEELQERLGGALQRIEELQGEVDSAIRKREQLLGSLEQARNELDAARNSQLEAKAEAKATLEKLTKDSTAACDALQEKLQQAQNDRARAEAALEAQLKNNHQTKLQTKSPSADDQVTHRWHALVGALKMVTRAHKSHSEQFSKLFPRAEVDTLEVEDLLDKLVHFASSVLGKETCTLWSVQACIREKQKHILHQKQQKHNKNQDDQKNQKQHDAEGESAAQEAPPPACHEGAPLAFQEQPWTPGGKMPPDDVRFAIGLAQQALQRVEELASAKAFAAAMADERAAHWQRTVEELRTRMKSERETFREMCFVAPVVQTSQNVSPDKKKR